MTENLTARTVHSAKWTYLAIVVNVVAQLGTTAALARLVAPSAFGVIAMSTLVLRFGMYFAQMGVGQSIVQRTDLSSDHVRAGVWTSLAVGTGFWLGAWALTPVVVDLFAAPGLADVLPVMAIVFVLSGTSTTALALLRRQMRFRAIALADVISYALGYAGIGVTLAAAGGGVWSLVGAGLGQAALASVFYNAVARPSARPLMTWRPYRELLGFGSTVSLISFLEFANANLDTLVVGRMAGSAALGVYSRALHLTGLPMQYMSTGLSRVLLPSFARIQDEPERIGRGYLVLLTVFAGLGLPVALGISGAAKEVVAVLLGPQWVDAVPVVRIAAFASCAAMLSHFGGVALEATAHLRDKLLMRSGQLVVFGATLVLLSRFGLLGFALAFAVSEIGLHIVLVRRASRLFSMPGREVRRAYWPGAICGLVCLVVLWLESAAAQSIGVTAGITLLVQACSGALLLVVLGMRAGNGRLFRVLRERIGHVEVSRCSEVAFRWLGKLAGQSANVETRTP